MMYIIVGRGFGLPNQVYNQRFLSVFVCDVDSCVVMKGNHSLGVSMHSHTYLS